ncbi:outer membrane beta-barrel protein [Riemerella anatipestifer]|nr:outer membrane beta-barrel protein [Riemerella anatipestifer]
MKKVFASLAIAVSSLMMGQISFGIRANALLNTSSPSWSDLKNNISESLNTKGSNITGFNIGLSAKINLPITSLFLMPEVYYTQFGSKTTLGELELKAKSDRLDVPVLVGYNVLSEKLSLFTGPVASYNLTSEETFKDFKENITKTFTVGYQLGANVRISDFVLNARYEGAFSKDQRDFIKTVSSSTNEVVRYDNRPSFFIVGLGYQF